MSLILPTIYVDTREKERPNPNQPGEVSGVDMLELVRRHTTRPMAEGKTLYAGDFSFIGEGPEDTPCVVGIERKRMRDMVNSMRGGRFSGEQLPKLMTYDRVYLIFEARWKTDWVTGQLMEKWGREWSPVFSGTKQIMCGLEMTSFLNDIRDKTPVTVLHSEDPRQTVELVMSLAHSWSKPWSTRTHHLDIHRPGRYVEIEKTSTVRRVAYSLSGVGWDKSATIESHFSTVAAMVEATVKDWERLPGFGKVLSRKMWGQLHGQNGED